MNPAFSREEWEERKSKMPAWRFDLFYRAIFTRPAGAIYDTFDEKTDCVQRFRIPPDWPRAIGIDFGSRNMAALKVALDPETLGHKLGPMIYVYRTYHKGGTDTADHVKTILSREDGVPEAVGGNQTGEDGWRNDFTNQGLHVAKPTVGSVTAGIQAVYGLLKTGRLKIFSDLEALIDEFKTYSYELDEDLDPIQDKIKDKAKYHRLDCARYVLSELVHNPGFARSREIISMLPDPDEDGYSGGDGYYN